MEKINTEIRGMLSEDVPEVSRLEKELFRNPWSDQAFIEELESIYSHPIVAQINNEIIGYAILWDGSGVGHLTNIAVDEKYQRKSVAKKLLSFIFRLARDLNLGQINLEVRPSNAGAIELYESLEFEVLATHKDYYQNPAEDCLIMKVEIKED